MTLLYSLLSIATQLFIIVTGNGSGGGDDDNNKNYSIFQGTFFENQGEVVFSSNGYFSILYFNPSNLTTCLIEIEKSLIHFELNQEMAYTNENVRKLYNTKLAILKESINKIKDVYNDFLKRLGLNINNNGNNDKNKEFSFIKSSYKYKDLSVDDNNNNITQRWQIELECSTDNNNSIISNIRPEIDKMVTLFHSYFNQSLSSSSDKYVMWSNITPETILSQTINTIQLNVQFIHEYVLNIIDEINKMFYGKLSLVLLNPSRLTQILDHLESAEHLVSIYPTLEKYNFIYYTMAQIVSVRKQNKNLLFILRIPLKATSKDDKYYLYKATSLWFLNENNVGEKIELENKYIALNQAKTTYTELLDLNTCVINNFIKLCTPTTAFFSMQNQPSCLTSLFEKKKHVSSIYCKSHILREFPKAIVKTQNGWVISTLHPFTLTQICPTAKGISDTGIDIKRGISHINSKMGCRLKDDYTSLPVFDDQKKLFNNAIYKFSTNDDDDENIFIDVLTHFNISSPISSTYLTSISLIKKWMIQKELENVIIITLLGGILLFIALLVIITFFYVKFNKYPLSIMHHQHHHQHQHQQQQQQQEQQGQQGQRNERVVSIITSTTTTSPPSDLSSSSSLLLLPLPPPPPPPPSPPLSLTSSQRAATTLYRQKRQFSYATPPPPPTTTTTTTNDDDDNHHHHHDGDVYDDDDYHHYLPPSPPPLPPPPPPPNYYYQNLEEKKKEEIDEMGYMICH